MMKEEEKKVCPEREEDARQENAPVGRLVAENHAARLDTNEEWVKNYLKEFGELPSFF